MDPAVPGRVVQLSLKPKEGRARGLPKRAVAELTITSDGGMPGSFARFSAILR